MKDTPMHSMWFIQKVSMYWGGLLENEIVENEISDIEGKIT